MDQTDIRPILLVAQNVTFIGQIFCDVAARRGFRVAGPFVSTAEVLGWIERWTPAVAILDASLHDGPTDDLAEVLRRRGVLVLVHGEVCGSSRQYLGYIG